MGAGVVGDEGDGLALLWGQLRLGPSTDLAHHGHQVDVHAEHADQREDKSDGGQNRVTATCRMEHFWRREVARAALADTLSLAL